MSTLGCRALAAASALALFTAVQPVASQRARGFSRSAWIGRHMDRVEFSGGVLPGAAPPPEVAERWAPMRVELDRRSTRPRRLSSDILIFEEGAQPGTQAEPYIHVDPFDPRHLVAGWQENRHEDGGAQALGVAVSFDQGGTWTESLVPGLTLLTGGAWERVSDPWVEFGPDNRVYFASLLFNETSPDNGIGVSVSTDGGLSWGPPIEVTRDLLDFNDKEALTVDVFPESRYFGRVYVGWDVNLVDASGESFVAQRLLVASSRRNGTFRRPRALRTGATNIGAIPRVGPDGTVYVIWAGRRTEDGELLVHFSRSTNGGRRWSSSRVLAELLTLGVPEIRDGNILPSFAVDPVSGHLFVAWQDARWSGVDQATLISSRDRGRSWSRPALVSAAPLDAPTFTTSVAVNGRGRVAVSYFSLENDPERAYLVDRYVRVSEDGGESFGPPVRVTRRTFDIRFAAQARGYFLGDYMGLAGGDEQFHSLWVSTKRRSPDLERRQPDVFANRTR